MTDSPLIINLPACQVTLGGRVVKLTNTEYRLLLLLTRHHGYVLERDEIARELWGSELGAGNLVRKYICRLRQKLGDQARDPRWVRHICQKRYQFIGPRPVVYTQPYLFRDTQVDEVWEEHDH